MNKKIKFLTYILYFYSGTLILKANYYFAKPAYHGRGEQSTVYGMVKQGHINTGKGFLFSALVVTLIATIPYLLNILKNKKTNKHND